VVSFNDHLKIGCNEQDLLSDDIIGSIDMELYEIINLNGFKKWIEINYKNELSGRILISTKLDVKVKKTKN
jgi:hypothetical protein